MKKIIITVLVALMLTTAAFAASEVTVTEAGNFHIYYNDVEQRFTDVNGTQVLPLVNNGTTYLPVRAMSNLAGLGVEWVAETSTIKLTSGGTQSIYAGIPTGSVNTVNVTVADNFTITLDGAVKTFTDVNGTVVYPLVNNGTTYLPVRAVCGLVNIAVEWDGTTSSIYLGTHTAAPAITTTKSIHPSTPDKTTVEAEDPFTTVDGLTRMGRYYTVDTTGYDYLRVKMAASTDAGSIYLYNNMEEAVAKNVKAICYDYFMKGTEAVLDVSSCSTVVLQVMERKPTSTAALTPITSITLESSAVVPAYSIPSGATALTDANTHFSTTDTTYSNGQFIRCNMAPLSHGADTIKFQNSGYTTLTFTVTTYATPMHVVVYDDPVVLSEVQPANTTKTYTADISSLQTVNFYTFNDSACDSIITNAYVK